MATLQALVLCDFAQVRDGLLFISSGGITRMWRGNLPAPLGVYVAGLLELEPDEVDRVHEVRLRVTGEGKTYAEGVGGFSVAPGPDALPGDSHVLPFSISLQDAGVDHHGVYDLAASVNGELAQRLTFRVMAPPG